ncbi:3-dehydro-L-gulonate 2-dehydrogenase [Paenibacillus sp. FSL H8-0034]|uniref:3-dehydro-L-gulonate 2-dehydrogenase n=1 Tax=Paenibacillus sp. FSL H8-0034 TaxID=2954671 RepID=UPI0030FAD87E
MIRIPFSEMKEQLVKVLLNMGFIEERAQLCAKLFAEASLDGVYSHGLNRFPSFVDCIKKGDINIHAVPEIVQSYGVIERWDGKLGPGNINAHFCMERAVTLAKNQGMGCVALKNTSHWMRGGSYGWQAVEKGCIGICWTNTEPNLPPWGSAEKKLGNNPIVFAVPREEGHIVLDMAISQYSYGQLNEAKLLGSMLHVEGGYHLGGELTRDPSTILESGRLLPIGYWKGSGFALLLDLIAMVLSGGNSTYEIGKLTTEPSISQVFIAFDVSLFEHSAFVNQRIHEVIRDLQGSIPVEEHASVRYPGEDTMVRRHENLARGIPVEPAIWQQVLKI